MELETQPTSVEDDNALRRYYGINPKTLFQLLSDEDIEKNVILDIQPIHVNISLAKQSVSPKQSVSVKPMSTGVITFFRKDQK